MIRVTYLRVIIDERSFEHKDFEFDPSLSISDYLAKSGFELVEHVVILSGRKIDYLSIKPEDGDQIMIRPEVEWEALVFKIGRASCRERV